MGRLGLLTLLFALGTACERAPTSPTPQARYPDMIGTWSGVEHVFGTVDGSFAEGDCAITWVIRSQSDGVFSGGYDRACAGESTSGDVAGSVLSNGVLTQHLAILRVGTATCVRVRLNWFEGVVTGTSLSMRISDEVNCTTAGTSVVVVRERQFSLRKS